MATIVQEDPNAPNPLGINLPKFGTQDQQIEPQKDTSFHLTVGGQPRSPGAENFNSMINRTAAGTQTDTPSVQTDVSSTQTDVSSKDPNPYTSDIQDALQQGYTKDEISGFLQQSKGITKEDADYNIVDSVSSKIKEARKVGHSDETIRNYMFDKNYDTSVIDKAFGISKKSNNWRLLDYVPDVNIDPKESAQSIVDMYDNIHSKYSTDLTSFRGLFDERKAIEARRDSNKLSRGIVKSLQDHGFDASLNEDNEVVVTDEQGKAKVMESSFFGSMLAAKAELIGGGYGMAVGAAVGSAVGAATPIPGGAFLFGIAGEAIGAGLSKPLDMFVNAARLKEHIDRNLYLAQMEQSGAAGAVYNVIGSAGFKLVSMVAKGVMKAYKYTIGGNMEGSIKILREKGNFSIEEAQDITRGWLASLEYTPTVRKGVIGRAQAKLAGYFVDNTNLAIPSDRRLMTPIEQQLSALALTQQGLTKVVAETAGKGIKTANIVKRGIDKRSKDVQKLISLNDNPNAGYAVRKELKKYRDDVKDFYGEVKQEGGSLVDGTDFRFNYDELAIDPIEEGIGKQIVDPTLQANFLGYLGRIEQVSKVRTFTGLIDLRQAVNVFKHNIAKKVNKPAEAAVNKVLNKIDSQIAKAARTYIPHSKQWMVDFKLAKSEYSKMKVLEKNALYKDITRGMKDLNGKRSGGTEAAIRKSISKYSSTNQVEQETYNAVHDILGDRAANDMEIAAIKNLVDKHTIGDVTTKQATNFPALAEELRTLNIVHPASRNTIKVINNLAKVFKNDIDLSGINPGMSFERVVSAMSDSQLAMLKFTLARKIFNLSQRALPTENAKKLALTANLDRLLQEPLSTKAADNLYRSLPKGAYQPDIESYVKSLRNLVAKQPVVKKSTVRMYKRSKSGKLVVTNGTLGKGIYLVDKIKNPTSEMNIIGHEVDISKLATKDVISGIVGVTDINVKDIKNVPGLRQELVNRGYTGIRLEGRVMLFPDKPDNVINLKGDK